MINDTLIVNVEERDQAVIITIDGILSYNGNDEFDNSFRKYAHSKLDVIALNLKNVLYIDSFGMSRIIKVSRAFIDTRTDFVLINLSDYMLHIFKITTLDKIFKIMNDKEFLAKYFSEE